MLFSSPPVPTARPNVGNIRILAGTNFQITHAKNSKQRLKKTCVSFQKGIEQSLIMSDFYCEVSSFRHYAAESCGLWLQQTMQASSIQSGD